MKSMKYFVGFFILFYVSSCTEDPSYSSKYIIQNNSDQKIEVNLYQLGELKDSILLGNYGDIKKYSYDSRAGSPSPPPFLADSVIIVYNDTTCVTHHRIEGQEISRNIFYKESWTGGQIDDFEYRYEYTLTNADYEEALNTQ